MRPERLTVQAFGPFADTQTLDFNALGDNPLFLINGPTGAGKSSILDAICYALYGQTTGKEREGSQMRCDYAPAQLLTEVSLEFSLGDARYRIQRSPTQDRPKARGDGMTEHKSEARLWKLEAAEEIPLVSKKVSEADEYINRLTGLNAEQFRQVMVLPQGKFRELLMAGSSEREKIFSQLFQTHIYSRIENALKEQAKDIEERRKSSQDEKKVILQTVDLSSRKEAESLLAESLAESSRTKAERDKTEAALKQVEAQLATASDLQQAFAELQQSEQKLTLLKQEATTIDELRQQLQQGQQAEAIRPQYQQTLDAQKRSQQIRESLSQNQQQLKTDAQAEVSAREQALAAQAQQPQLDAHKQQLRDLEALKPRLDELAEVITSATRAAQRVTAARTELSQQEASLEQCKAAIQRHEQQLSDGRQQLALLGDKKQQFESLKNLGLIRKKLDELEQEQSQLLARQQAQLAEVQTQGDALESQQLSLKKLEFAWHSNQAAILAQELAPNQPCPVCGSSQHPAPAQASEPQVEKAEIEQAKVSLKEQESHLQQASLALTQIETQLQSVQGQIAEHQGAMEKGLQESAWQTGTPPTTDSLRQACEQLRDEIKQLGQLEQQLSATEQQIHKLKQQRDTGDAALSQQRGQLQEWEQQQALLSQQQSQLEAALPEAQRSLEALNQGVQEQQGLIRQIEGQQQQTRTALEQASRKLSATQSLCEEQAKQTQQAENEQVEAESVWQQALASSALVDEAGFTGALQTVDALAAWQSQIDSWQTQFAATEGALKQQQQTLADKTPPDMDLLSAERDKVQAQRDQVLAKWQQWDNQVNQLQGLLGKLDAAEKASKELDEEYAIYGTLSEVANGKTGHKVSLQRFVLGVLLDDVLSEASERLNLMSKGRYRLFRKEEKARRGASGLELEVEDAYTGRNRPVATLSGGESFMAALSLALGLSDVVQAYAGGIRLDTLFIDEGFGSLDQESLDLAIRTLIDLQSTGRMVGIISHVSELREQMPLKVDIKPSASGSRIQL